MPIFSSNKLKASVRVKLWLVVEFHMPYHITMACARCLDLVMYNVSAIYNSDMKNLTSTCEGRQTRTGSHCQPDPESRLLIGRYGHLDQSAACYLGQSSTEYDKLWHPYDIRAEIHLSFHVGHMVLSWSGYLSPEGVLDEVLGEMWTSYRWRSCLEAIHQSRDTVPILF